MLRRRLVASVLAFLLITSFYPLSQVRAADQPVLVSVSPTTVQAGQSVRLTLTGSGLANVNQVWAGNVSLTELNVTDTVVTALIPVNQLLTLGLVDVSVKDTLGQSFTLPQALEILSNPVIEEAYRQDISDSGSPEYRRVPTIGGVPIVITGTGFAPGLSLSIGGQPATNVRVETGGTKITADAPASTTGGKEVMVINPDGGQSVLPGNSANTLFYRLSSPRIESITPGYGSTLGGTLVTIAGEEFDAADRIKVQIGTGFASVEGVSADHKSITVRTPSGTVGTVPVIVTNADGVSVSQGDGFEYVVTPTISSVTPNFGPTSGGSEIQIRGTNFPEAGSLGVKIAGREALEVTRVSDTLITAVTPPGPLGPAPVEIFDLSDTKKGIILADGFTYKESTSSPQIDPDGIQPNTGSTTGGDLVRITGRDFLAGSQDNPTRVFFGGVPAPEVVVESTTSLRVVTPPGQAGWRSVELVNPDGGTCKIENGFLYKVPEKLVLITGVTPAQGVLDEQRRVVLSGANFLEPGESPNDVEEVEVRFGGNLAADITIIDSRTISVIAPLGGALGPQNVSVKISRVKDGRTVVDYAELTGGYTYEPPRRTPWVESVLNPETNTAEGPLMGGSLVIIKGHYFEARPGQWPEVYFGDRIPANKAQVVEVTVSEDEPHDHNGVKLPVFSILAHTPPAKVPGTVPVWVVNPPVAEGDQPVPGVLENGFTYRGNNLYLSSVTPDRGPLGGGTYVEIAGENFGWSSDPSLLKLRTHVFVGAEEATIQDIVINDSGLDVIRIFTPAANKAGAQDVKVANPFGSAILKAAFNYYDRLSQPVIESVLPEYGSGEGGAQLTITGTDFASGATVTVGERPATEVEVRLKLDTNGQPVVHEKTGRVLTEITCVAPAGKAGPARITVTNRDGGTTFADGLFTYISVPHLTKLEPTAGTISGETWVVLSGEGFLKEDAVIPSVYFGGVSARAVEYISETELAVKTPPAPTGEAGAVDVEVVNPDAGRDGSTSSGRVTLVGGFEYRVPNTSPRITALDPDRGSVGGGTRVVIQGSDFREGVQVYFGYKKAAKVERRDDQLLAAITPPGKPGAVDVTVINPGYGQAQSRAGAPDEGGFTYVVPRSLPELHSIFPAEGSSAGGDLVTLTGVDFRLLVPDGGSELQAPTVRFGNQRAEVVAVLDSLGMPLKGPDQHGTVLKVRTPPGMAGAVDVSVTNADAAHALLPRAFTYRETTTYPEIESLSPAMGQASGGTPVVVRGRDFAPQARVYFGGRAGQKVIWESDTALVVWTPPGPAGRSVDVTVINPDGANATLEGAFAYQPDPQLRPRISTVVPNQGPVSGGTEVDIWGSNFQPGLKVVFGAVIITDPEITTGDGGAGQSIRVTAPARELPGPVDIAVVNPDGGTATASEGYTYTELTLPVEISAIAPSKGPRSGNIPAQITGSDFLTGARVYLGGLEAVAVTVLDASTIALTVPAIPAGQGDQTVDVVVVNPDGGSARLEDGFTYTEPESSPKISRVKPASGRTQGGTPVTISGSGFTTSSEGEAPGVFFAGRLAQEISWVNETTLWVRTPPGEPGWATVTVINPDGGAATLVNGFTYEERPGPQVTAIDPVSGPSAGGTQVTITGSGFDPGVSVTFGAAAAQSVERQSDTALLVVTPAHDLGTVDITVTNPDGSSFTLPEAFTFVGPPKAPTGLRARAVSANTIELTWTAAKGAVSYEIFMGKDRNEISFLARSPGEAYGSLDPEERCFYVEDLEPDTRYYFSVRAVNDQGVSGQALTASARTRDKDESEPQDTPDLPEVKVTRGSGGVVVTVASGTLGRARRTIDLDKPEYAGECRFTIQIPALDVDERTSIRLDTARFSLSFPVWSLESTSVRKLSRKEAAQAAVLITVGEAQGAEAQAMLRTVPPGFKQATPLYQVEARLLTGASQDLLSWFQGDLSLFVAPEPGIYARDAALYRYIPEHDTFKATGTYFNPWTREAVIREPGYYIVLYRSE